MPGQREAEIYRLFPLRGLRVAPMAMWRTDGLTEGQAAVRRLVGLGAAVLVLVLVGVFALLVAGSRALDDLQAREDRALATGVLDRSLRRMVSDLTTATVWDQAYRELRPASGEMGRRRGRQLLRHEPGP